jgi:hypothetical protein
MKTKANSALIEAINVVYKDSKGQKLSPENLAQLKPSLRIIAGYLNVTQEQALIFALIVVDSYSGDTVNINEICRHLDVNTTTVIQYYDAFEKLEERSFLISKPKRMESSEIITNKEFIAHHEVANAILKHEECPKIQKKKIISLIDAFGEIYSLVEKLESDDISRGEFKRAMSKLYKELSRFDFVNKMKVLGLQDVEFAVLVYVVWNVLSGSNGVDVERLTKSMFGSPSERMNFLQELKKSESDLTKHELLEIVPSRFLNDIALMPTNGLASMLKEHGIKMEINKSSKRSNIIEPSSIGEKNLFYNPAESTQILSVRSMMEDDNYQALMERLSSKNLPTSMNILLYGAPGTGKTESVLQLARMSGREIMKVEISQTKSMWFGESEKIIKKVFTDYAEYAKRSAKTPILLFNEADAILGNRSELSGSSAVRQTENTIQNILLEELENFKGIFFATTNFATNLDKAFERRFLFKVEFNKPSIEARTQIWMNKLSFLHENDALVLAQQFELSGGQIENIVRKSEINFILNGEIVPLDQLIVFCQEEQIGKSGDRNTIGF